MSALPPAPEAAELQPHPQPASEGQPRSLRSRMMGAGLWSAASVGLGHVLRLGGNLIVTRLLMPEAFGVMAIVLTVSMVLYNLSDIGLHQSVVRHARGKERVFLNTVWSVQIVRGFLLGTVAALLGAVLYLVNLAGWVPLDSAYAAPELPWVLAASGIGSMVYGFHSTTVSTAVREFDMRRYVMLEVSQQLVAIISMIVLAWWMRSIWAIVVANLLGTVFNTLLSHRMWPGERNRWAWDPQVLRDLLQFGKWLLLSSALGVWALNADRLLLAGVGDARFMGLYSIAFGLASALSLVIERLFGSVLLPAFSDMARNQPQRLAEIYFKARRKVDPIVLLSSGLLFATGPLIISVLYDSRYREAGEILSILALALVLMRQLMALQVYLALDLPKYYAMVNVARVISTFTLIPLALALGGLTWGLFAVAWRELPVVLFMARLNGRHGLNHWGIEFGMLVFWPIGFAIGQGCNQLARWMGPV